MIYDQMERLIALTASLPHNSKMRDKLTQKLVGTLWDSLQHPPLSYYGEQYQYRTADGSYNVIRYIDENDQDDTANTWW